MLVSINNKFEKPKNRYERKCVDRKTSSTDVTNLDFHIYFTKKYNIEIKLSLFIDIIKSYNLLLQEELLKGETIELSSKLGKLFIKESPRKFTKESFAGDIYVNLRVDWGKTRKLNLINPETGKFIPQYYTDQTEFYRVIWYCTYYTKNVLMTYFNTSNTLKERIARSLEKNESVHFKFKKNAIDFKELLEKHKQNRTKFFRLI